MISIREPPVLGAAVFDPTPPGLGSEAALDAPMLPRGTRGFLGGSPGTRMPAACATRRLSSQAPILANSFADNCAMVTGKCTYGWGRLLLDLFESALKAAQNRSSQSSTSGAEKQLSF